MQTFGECEVEIGGQLRILRGDVEMETSGLDTTVEGNMDATVHQTAKTAPCTLKLTLEQEQSFRVTKQEQITPRDVVFRETMNGQTHYFNNAKMHGKPSYNPSNGALTGITYACAYRDYRKA